MKKKHILSGIGKISFGNLMLGLFAVCCLLTSCDDDVSDDAYYTFKGETVASFCKNSKNLSIFYKIIEESDNYSLLSVYGHFTCFAPNDSAFNEYFKAKGISYDDLTTEDKTNIVYNHIIKNETKEYLSEDFTTGTIPIPNMNERYLSISYVLNQGRQVIMVNKLSPILSKDNEVHNGVIHIMGHVIEPSQNDLFSIMEENGNFKLFSEAFELTNLRDSIQAVYDDSYVDRYPGVDFIKVRDYDGVGIFHRKKLGYTILAETDDVFRAAGINDLAGLIELAKRYYGSEDLNDYTSRNNPLNKFISYHMLNRQMSTSSFIYSGPNTSSYAMDQRHEYYETMLHLRMIEFKADNKINTQKNGKYVGIDNERSDFDGVNGFIHGLTDILVYDENIMQTDVLNKRMRIDSYAIAPELTNNNVRWNLAGFGVDKVTITPDFCGESFKFNDATQLILWASNSWDDHQADEMSFRGWYDFTFRLPPVPPGTYEIRLGYSCREWGGVTQVFFDNEIVGIPINFYTTGDDASIGWIADAQTPDNGVENDKAMRNKGYMKGGNAICNSGWGYATNRNSPRDLRIIIGTYTFQEYGYHYFRARNVDDVKGTDGEFHCDYFEIVPVSYIEQEGID